MKKKTTITISLIFLIIIFAVTGIFVIKNHYENKITIMLDPGHGGPQENQRGAIVATGGREVTLNNNLSNKIGKLLKKDGYRVTFTNDPDDEEDYIPLIDRCNMANKCEPDLFISVHHDAIEDPTVRGFTIYYSSYRPNIDDEGTYVLYKNKEYNLNKVEILGSRTHVFYEDNNEIKELVSGHDVYKVRDKTPSKAAQESKNFAGALYNHLVDLDYIEPLRDDKENTIIDNDLMVTRSTNMPSILIEAGFVSNMEEAKLISNGENQDLFAEKVVDAVNEYFNK